MFFLKELPSREMMDRYGSRYPEMDVQAVEDALALMRRASLLIRDLEAYFSGLNLSLLRFLILIVIDREPGRSSLTMGEIIERVDISKPVMTRTVRTLEDDGLIVVAPDDRDRRSKAIVLTEHGKDVLDDVLPGYFALISDFMRAGDGR
ncbi:MarR family winged helix-turn-helix transcriptional regulator [Phytoactinopolyspora mesophila]|uniref:MarR family transcriptional regulator n=1 Tax=Phytoactinopolyspora mesophila TaxID=2650750 RepID=A0A7K3M511_9ACTN|nr:MarR family transcriptional regulator [Phytoactinopolyspora mesophila]NDL58335.1 MarR family transcriptional regulator [Phytoactinopolyspora mesophila]